MPQKSNTETRSESELHWYLTLHGHLAALPVKDAGTTVGTHIWRAQHCSHQLVPNLVLTPTLTMPLGMGRPL